MKTNDSDNSSIPPNPVDKPGYRLEFNDDFTDENLDTSKWLPFYLPQWSSRELSAARYSLKDSMLRLFIEEDQPPWCPAHDGNVRVSSLQTGCFSGPAGTSIGQHRFKPGLTVTEPQPTTRLYTPQFGYFETRLRALPIPGYMVSFWMIGFEESPEQSAEICICEIFGSDVGLGASKVGYGIRPFDDPSITDDFHRDSLAIDAAAVHIYAAEWRPNQVEFFMDNVSLMTLPQSPQYPMQFMLGFYEIPDQQIPGSLTGEWPKTVEVNYVRGYQPVGGYVTNA